MTDSWAVVVSFACFGALIMCTINLLREYASRNTSWPYTVTVYFAWVLGFAGTLLLPIDIAHGMVYGASPVFKVLWGFIFWTTFLLAWVFIPLLMEYWAAGDFTWRERLATSVKVNLKFYAAISIGLLLIVVWLLFSGEIKQLEAYLIAAANAWGLLLIVALLGHGLVSVPRSLWRAAYPDRQLAVTHFRCVRQVAGVGRRALTGGVEVVVVCARKCFVRVLRHAYRA